MAEREVSIIERKLNCRQYDIIFLDLDMPILNGYEACKKIKDFYLMSSVRKKASKSSQSIKEKKHSSSTIWSKQIEITRLR